MRFNGQIRFFALFAFVILLAGAAAAICSSPDNSAGADDLQALDAVGDCSILTNAEPSYTSGDPVSFTISVLKFNIEPVEIIDITFFGWAPFCYWDDDNDKRVLTVYDLAPFLQNPKNVTVRVTFIDETFQQLLFTFRIVPIEWIEPAQKTTITAGEPFTFTPAQLGVSTWKEYADLCARRAGFADVDSYMSSSGYPSTVYDFSILYGPAYSYDHISGSVRTGSQSYSILPVEEFSYIEFEIYFGPEYGWALLDFPTGGTINITLFYEFAVVPQVAVYHTVTFDSNGGSLIAPQTVEHGQKAIRPTDPVYADHVFLYWADDETGKSFEFDSPITEPRGMSAHWMSLIPATIDIKPGKSFEYYFETVPGLTPDIDPLGIGINIDPGTNIRDEWGDEVVAVLWRVFGSTSTKGTVTIYDWSSEYPNLKHLIIEVYDWWVVTFNTAGGSYILPQNVTAGGKATQPPDPEREGYTFAGWYLGADLFDWDSPVMTDIELAAAWDEIIAGGDDTDKGSGLLGLLGIALFVIGIIAAVAGARVLGILLIIIGAFLIVQDYVIDIIEWFRGVRS